MRSLTKVGLCSLRLFDDSMDINLARQLSSNDCLKWGNSSSGANAAGAEQHRLGRGISILSGEAARFCVKADAEQQSLIEQRTIQDWVIRPLLKSTPEVIDVN